jgi:protein SCO1/2
MGPDAPQNVGFEQKLGAQIPLDTIFYDHNSKSITLGEVINGKPTILVLHYNRCPKLCNRVIQGVLDALKINMRKDANFVAGQQFHVAFVSIDPKESPAAARKSREEFHREYDQRGEDDQGIWFLTANHGQGTNIDDADQKIHQLAASVGFKYALRYNNQEYYYEPTSRVWTSLDGRRQLKSDIRNYDYEHSPGLIIVTPTGTVSQYIGGLSYDSVDNPNSSDVKITGRDIRMALVAASNGTIGTFADMIAPYCFAYDSKTGHYAITMRYVALFFAPIYILVGYIAFRTIRQVYIEPKLKPGDSGQGVASNN